MKILRVNFIVFFFSVLSIVWATSYNDSDLVFPSTRLGGATIHMLKILPTRTGSAPVVEIRFDKKYRWLSTKPTNVGGTQWGVPGATYTYKEDIVQGSHVAFGNYNHIYDVSYYKCEGSHPCSVPLYKAGSEKAKMERFIFFRFTATAAKGSRFFERVLDNYMVALDTHTKLLFSYGAPSDYESIIGGNYIPLKWLAYEAHPNTRGAGYKFYQYDPIGYVQENWNINVGEVITNVVIYEWWNESVRAGNSYKNVRARRFMPHIDKNASRDYMVREPNIPIASPYRDGMEL